MHVGRAGQIWPVLASACIISFFSVFSLWTLRELTGQLEIGQTRSRRAELSMSGLPEKPIKIDRVRVNLIRPILWCFSVFVRFIRLDWFVRFPHVYLGGPARVTGLDRITCYP